jgi:DNA invertase Pin-like site-specific DNA recombinase
MNQMLLTMLGAVSAFELSMINERRAEGQAKTREAGKHMGHTANLSAQQAAVLCNHAADGESKTDLAAEFGISCATLYSTIKART